MPQTTRLRDPVLGVVLVIALLTTLAACADDPAGSALPRPSASPSATGVYDDNLAHHPSTYGTLGPGYPALADPPAPGGTFSPSPDSWAGVRPPEGYRVTLVAEAHNAPTDVIIRAVRAWAAAESVDLDVIRVATPADNLADLSKAIRAEPDLVVAVGNTLIDAMALVTASAMNVRFLVLGGELAEPTANVTAVDWAGAGFRGEGLGKPTTYDAATFTPERADDAIRAGVAAVLTNWSGFVVWL